MFGKRVVSLRCLGAGVLVLSMTALLACSGKSRSGGGDEDGDDGTGGDASRGGTSGEAGQGGTSGDASRGGTSGEAGQGGTGGPSTSGAATLLDTKGVEKVDLLFMVDNSISMGDKQRLLAEAMPVLVQRLIDPICVGADGNPVGGTNAGGCAPNTPEYPPIEDIHIGIITSSLGNHGGDVCVTDPAEMPPRTLNDSAQLIASVRTGVYSYAGLGPHGFLVWDPRVGDDRPVPETHPGLTAREQNPDTFVQDFATQIQAAGERGCGYEASLEAWYRFLIDPEPINQVTVDPTGQFNVRGPINPVVLGQRRAFMRPDSLLAIVMLTDENDCSINDEEGHQGWLVGRRVPMPRGSDACAHPEDPSQYRCCIPCVLLDSPSFQPVAGCSYGADVSCNGGHSLMPVEDSTNLRCFRQVERFGLNLLYPWQRYADALKAPRIALRLENELGDTEVTNPIYTPGADGTPARGPHQVFLSGIIGVPWQDIATGASVMPGSRALTYLTALQMRVPPTGTPAGDRWDVILGDPDGGRRPTDPFMHETIDPRVGSNPITADTLMPPGAGSAGNAINGSEQNIANRDDLQYACIFDLDPDVPCTMANQDGCDCNASEQAYGRPLCNYSGSGTDGTQTHAKAYPGIRHLQVLKAFGENSIVASICPKNVTPQGGDPSADPDYGYNPAVAAIVDRVKEAFSPSCLPRPIATDTGEIECLVVEVSLDGCACDSSGRSELPSSSVGGVLDGLTAAGLCGGNVGRACSDYCLCEVRQLAGDELTACQNTLVDPGTIEGGFCYVDPDAGHGQPELVEHCPAAQRQLIRFMGDGPAPGTAAFLVCPGD